MELNAIESYNDIASHDLQHSTTEHIVSLLNTGLDGIVHVPRWLTEEEDVPTVGPDDNLVVGDIADHSEKSIRITTANDNEHYLPKSQVTVFVRGSERIDSPQQGLTDYGGEQR
ncbi:hypothetical protein B4589_009780 [Halolamina sp. CBA1230]|uniref:hypothetical protein n=1 Tax=Halolamina sp. CBA1230 TaxID=1853690 RepID=UPI0009A23892|nr:hypothetical protein [Halolamina sp. CBA1230]QKY20654.1 hypothetical protein B4589_009780 [Halolamina sp. CBA1230]